MYSPAHTGRQAKARRHVGTDMQAQKAGTSRQAQGGMHTRAGIGRKAQAGSNMQAGTHK